MIEESLACYRLTRLVAQDEITASAREAFQKWAVDNRHPKLHYLSTCQFCLSLWMAPLVLLLPARARRALAVAGAVAAFHDLLER